MRPEYTRRSLLGTAGAAAFLPSMAMAQSLPGWSESYVAGVRVLREGLTAAGGIEAVSRLGLLQCSFSGGVCSDLQAYSPRAINAAGPHCEERYSLQCKLDLAGSRYWERMQQTLPGGFELDFVTVLADGQGRFLRAAASEYTEFAAPGVDGLFSMTLECARYAPPLALLRALQNYRTVTMVGTVRHDGQQLDVIEFSWTGSQRYRLHLSQNDRQIRRAEIISNDPLVGDDALTSIYAGARSAAGLTFPQDVTVLRREREFLSLTLTELAVNQPIAHEQFALPDGSRLVRDNEFAVEQIAPGVYEVRGLGGGLYRSHFVVMNDFVVAFDAPLNRASTARVISAIGEVAPRLPIRHVVISHFHADHAAGVGAYSDAGATIIAPRDAHEALRAYASGSPATPQPDGSAAVSLAFEPGDGGITIQDGSGRQLRVVDFANTRHATHLLALYVTHTGTLIEGDLYSNLVPYNPTFEQLARWLRRQGTAVNLIAGTHHAPIGRTALLSHSRTWRGRGPD